MSIKINARLRDLFAVTWKTLPGKTVWIQGTSSRPDRLPRLSTQNKNRDRYSHARARPSARALAFFFFFFLSSGSQSQRRACERALSLLTTFTDPPSPSSPTSITRQLMEPDTDGDEKQTVWSSDEPLHQFASRKFPPGFPSSDGMKHKYFVAELNCSGICTVLYFNLNTECEYFCHH